MQQAADLLVGERDFTSFRAAQCQALSPVKHLRQARVSRRGRCWRFDFEADAFLHHMVRNIMGCLVAVGRGQHGAAWLDEVLAARNRAAAAPTFAPDGLYFVGPYYDVRHAIPEHTPAMHWLP
jgi:tRNA pseudouridine38-40 synthase